MEDVVRPAFWGIALKHGHAICLEPKRLEGMLLDACPGNRREISALLAAIQERVYAELQAGAATSGPMQVGRLSQQLCDGLGLQEDLARWAVETLAVALNVIRQDQARTSPGTTPPAQLATPSPLLPVTPAAPQRTCAKCGQSYPLPAPGSTRYAACPSCRTIAYVGPCLSPLSDDGGAKLPGLTGADGSTSSEGVCPGCSQYVQVIAPPSTFHARCPSCNVDLYVGP